MEKITVDQIKEVLSKINYPGFTRDIVSFGVVKDIEIEGSEITVKLKFTTSNEQTKQAIRLATEELLSKRFSNYHIRINEETLKIQAERPGQASASGKGGVGKSTVSTNLAIALAQKGLKIGLMDSDIYGPSIHIMMGIDERPMVTSEQKIIPLEKFGIKMMSMGFLVDSDAPLIWRGPLVMKAVEQFLRDVVWGDLDILVIDLPPGTGDAQLTLVQKTPINGAIIVTTPQEVSLIDARRGLKMFQKVNTKVLGIVENMSYYICPKCGHKEYIFGGNHRA